MEKGKYCTKRECQCGKGRDSFAIFLMPEPRETMDDAKDERGGDEKVRVEMRGRQPFRYSEARSYKRLLATFRFGRDDLACEERVTGLFDGGSGLPPRSRSLFLLIFEDAK
jgi:hypothetical protein